MMTVLIGDVVLTVNVGKELGEQFKTEMGIAQCDYLSAVGPTIHLLLSKISNT